jgi:hypothetical protein
MTGLAPHRRADGTLELISPGQHGDADYALLHPLRARVERILELLGGPSNPVVTLNEALEITRLALKEIREVEPKIDDSGKEAIAGAQVELRHLQREVRDTLKLFERRGA